MIKNLLLILVIIVEQFGFNFLPKSLNPNNQKVQANNPVYTAESYLENLKPLPEKENQSDFADITARAYLAVDLDTGFIFLEKNPEEKLPMASLAKIMTALVVLEELDLDEEVIISETAIASYGESIALRLGERLLVEDLLYAILLESSNDSAVALAEKVSGSEKNFVILMNKKAEELGLKNTKFKNATGLDEDNQYSTVSDLAVLTKKALYNKKFFEIASTYSKTIVSKKGINHYLVNSNKLMSRDKNFKGIKTGLTDNAGQCLISLKEVSEKNILTIILGSQNRFSETTKMINYIVEDFLWIKK